MHHTQYENVLDYGTVQCTWAHISLYILWSGHQLLFLSLPKPHHLHYCTAKHKRRTVTLCRETSLLIVANRTMRWNTYSRTRSERAGVSNNFHLSMMGGLGLLWVFLAGVAVFSSWTTSTTPSKQSLHGNDDKAHRFLENSVGADDDTQQQRVQILYDIDQDALDRFKAAPTGYRYHPSYYSDKYLRRTPLQSSFVTEQLTQTWGSWTLVDSKSAIRPGDDFYNQYPNRDVPWADFSESTAWQKDATYLPQFLDQGIALVERAMEAILTEYGYGSDRDDRPLEERMALLGVSPQVGKARPGTGASVVGNSYQGLVRRILHAIVSQDTFTLAMAGHSSAAGE